MPEQPVPQRLDTAEKERQQDHAFFRAEVQIRPTLEETEAARAHLRTRQAERFLLRKKENPCPKRPSPSTRN